ncbi:MAG: 3-methyl-2-oxobutanoate hydroxymethyltransferase, partial [Bacteroidaceae bacterium]|nr:3-methyl-2-oxobutanoate hydroxymethyltransferase [Bacteroidaceae bacterium]
MAGYIVEDTKKITTQKVLQMKKDGKKIAMLTCYDYTMAQIVDQAGVDIVLVGDSASNVVCGNQYTLPITVDEMIFLAKGVVRAAQHALVVVDMPFGTYQVSREEGIRNAVRMMAESGVDALKLEGGEEIIDTVKGIINTGI